MVIQSNMSPKSIVEVWKDTAPIFLKFNIPLTEKTLETTLGKDTLTSLLIDLNAAVESTTATCIEGG
ncbi:hypothetical protein J7I93_24460 [Bacillus sp. ISL-47]|uniref:hypothetical protein n=1 Tax=Bacillus sp. ISL-47 TaxID=2819130 RepID=UPI001BEB42EF|nr:hypothetical protein [Bacillus sp. ISL-47]MBT2691292.1 hypothetical protein [Bacillus sp. ISL-47]MBT2710560.1 hypothetical protein [Pseudomonas sp. ISL-84]